MVKMKGTWDWACFCLWWGESLQDRTWRRRGRPCATRRKAVAAELASSPPQSLQFCRRSNSGRSSNQAKRQIAFRVWIKKRFNLTHRETLIVLSSTYSAILYLLISSKQMNNFFSSLRHCVRYWWITPISKRKSLPRWGIELLYHNSLTETVPFIHNSV